MELAHNIGHGQWDWMNDPEIHSTSWEWDMVGVSSQWRYSHNYRHHVFTNIVGVDDDLGYGVLRVTRDQRWKPANLLQPLRHVLLSATFEWGVALQDLDSERDRVAAPAEKSTHTRALLAKIARQMAKDYLLFPALGLTHWRRVPGCQCNGQPVAKCLGLHGHLLRALRRWGRDIRPAHSGERDETRVVPPANAGQRKLPCGSGVGVHERPPLLSDRAPPVSRSAEQSLCGDRTPGAGSLCDLRPAVHHRSAGTPVPVGVAEDPRTDTSGPSR